MNMQLKPVFFCCASNHRWDRGLTIQAAMKEACITSFKPRGVDFYVKAALFNNPSDAELENLCKCITADQIDGSPKYYDYERTQEDTDMINKYHVGWVMIHKTKGVS